MEFLMVMFESSESSSYPIAPGDMITIAPPNSRPIFESNKQSSIKVFVDSRTMAPPIPAKLLTNSECTIFKLSPT